MASHIETGKLGEKLAKAFLEERGFEIIATNWRYSKAEIDIIARDNGVLVFVEVKTRASNFWADPVTSITPKKERLLVDAASAYMESIHYEWEIRFDVIGIILKKDHKPTISYYRDAFFPGLK